jgi:peptidoglycan/LPS O-acetylase OafA/YrhL
MARPLSLIWLTILAAIVFMTRSFDWMFYGGLSLTALAATGLIASVADNTESLVARALSFKPLAALGKISYGLYLWHFPVALILAEKGIQEPRFSMLFFLLSLGGAAISYLLIERRFLGMRHGNTASGRHAGKIGFIVSAP